MRGLIAFLCGGELSGGVLLGGGSGGVGGRVPGDGRPPPAARAARRRAPRAAAARSAASGDAPWREAARPGRAGGLRSGRGPVGAPGAARTRVATQARRCPAGGRPEELQRQRGTTGDRAGGRPGPPPGGGGRAPAAPPGRGALPSEERGRLTRALAGAPAGPRAVPGAGRPAPLGLSAPRHLLVPERPCPGGAGRLGRGGSGLRGRGGVRGGGGRRLVRPPSPQVPGRGRAAAGHGRGAEHAGAVGVREPAERRARAWSQSCGG